MRCSGNVPTGTVRLAGMVTGGAMVFYLEICDPYQLGRNGALTIYELLPAFLVSCVAIVVVSLVTAPPSKEIQDEFDRV